MKGTNCEALHYAVLHSDVNLSLFKISINILNSKAQKHGVDINQSMSLFLPGTGLPSGKTLTIIGPMTYLLGTLGTAVKYCCTLVDASSCDPNVFPPLLGLGPASIPSNLKFSKQNPLDLREGGVDGYSMTDVLVNKSQLNMCLMFLLLLHC